MYDGCESVGFSTPFTKMVNEDIEKCKNFLANECDNKVGKNLHIELTSKYSDHLNDIGSNMYEYNPNNKFFDIDYLDDGSLIHNLTVLMNKLIAFQNNDYQNGTISQNSGIKIENNLTATQSQTISISFEQVKKQIEDMTALSESETEETLAKIDEIKSIVETEENKKTKWQKLKPILIWIADKSVDVGIALLPLLLKIGG